MRHDDLGHRDGRPDQGRVRALPAPDGVRLWSLALEPHPSDAGIALLDDADTELVTAMARQGRDLGVRRLQARRALVRAVVASVAGCRVVEVGALGGPGPRTVAVADGRRWFASVSSAGPVGLLAVAHRPVGVDLEALPGPPDALLVSEQLLPAQEHAWVSDDPGPDGERFLRTWVRKEAFVKCTGEGMSRDLRSFVVDARHDVAEVCDERGAPLGVRTSSVVVPGHVAALAQST